MGTTWDAARAPLAERLGIPEAEEQPCQRPERRDSLDVPLRGQQLVWPSLTAYFTPVESGELVLTGWEATAPPSTALARYDVRLPFDTRLEQSVEEVLRQVPDSSTSVPRQGRDAGLLIISSSKVGGMLWVSLDQDAKGDVYAAAYDPEGCR